MDGWANEATNKEVKVEWWYGGRCIEEIQGMANTAGYTFILDQF